MGGCSSSSSSSYRQPDFTAPVSGDLDSTITDRWTGAIVLAPDMDPKYQAQLDNNNNNNRKSKSSTMSQKIRVLQASRIIIVGDHRVKLATARYIRANNKGVEIFVGLTDPHKHDSLRTEDGFKLLEINLSNSFYNTIKRLDHIDCAFIVSPASSSKIQETCQAINSFKRAGVSHVVILSNTVVERDADKSYCVFADQCRSIETYLTNSGLGYTIVRVPVFMDNYISQIDSIMTNGLLYRPVNPKTRRNTITIADLSEAVGKILITPLPYADRVVSLNGCLTSCEEAAEAFSKALGRPVVYEQLSKASYKSMMLNAMVPEWQAEGLLMMFELYDNKEPFCLQSTTELTKILGRPPTDVFAFADQVIQAVKAKTQGGKHKRLALPDANSVDSSAHGGVVDTQPHVFLDNARSIRPTFDLSSVQLHLPPQGIRGVLNVGIGLKQHPDTRLSRAASTDESTSTPPPAAGNTAKARSSSTTSSIDADDGTLEGAIKLTNYGTKSVTLLDGIVSFVPVRTTAAAGSPELLALSHNKAFSLAGFVLQKDQQKLKLTSSRGEDVIYILEAQQPGEEVSIWEERLLEHIDFCDRSRSVWMF